MDVIFVQIEFLGDLRIRKIESHEIQTQNPHPKRLMMASKDRVSQIVETSFTRLTQVTLTLGLGVVVPLFDDLWTLTMWALHPIWPA